MRGFTLIEVLVVVMIITILGTIVTVNLVREPGRARVAAARAQIGAEFATALDMYRMDNGRYPTEGQGLEALCEKPVVPPAPRRWREEGYLKGRSVPRDPWENEYVYLVPGPDREPYEIISYGADGEPGGTGQDTDITSAER